MTRDELVTALAEDQEITKTKVEDILQAITDLCVETLASGQPFHLGNIGFFAVHPPLPLLRGDLRGMMIFQGDEAFRARLGLTQKQPKRQAPHTCKTCGIEPCKMRVYDECDSCLHRRGKNSKEGGSI